MTVAPDYQRQFSFTNFQSTNPAEPLPGNEVDAELNAVKATSDAVNANLQLIQRSDGQLANQSVGYPQLQGAILTGMNPPTQWSGSAVNYNPGDLVFYGTQLYVCNTANTSSIVRPPVSNAAWTFLVDFSGIAVPAGSIVSSSFAPGAVNSAALGPGLALPASPATDDDSTMIATTAFVRAAFAAGLAALPTSLPGSAGVLWNNGGALSIS